jgi:hypothetical protein
MKAIIIFFFFFCIPLTLLCQKESYNWYFGNDAGITFMPDGKSAKYLSGCKL